MLWAIARFLISFDPPLLTYDDYNRLFTLPLMLVLAGNAVEFCGVLFQARPNTFVAVETGKEAWAGSDIGWIIFGLGHFIAALGALATGLAGPPVDGHVQKRSLLIAIAVLAATTGVALLMTWIPAAQAGRITPAEALRYE